MRAEADFCGRSLPFRSFYYEGENRGYWKLARIRERGKLRGVTLVPYDSVAAFVRSQVEA